VRTYRLARFKQAAQIRHILIFAFNSVLEIHREQSVASAGFIHLLAASKVELRWAGERRRPDCGRDANLRCRGPSIGAAVSVAPNTCAT
jgi:hypothetical protein